MIRWQVPDDLLSVSIEIMRRHGAKGNEGLALWLGEPIGEELVKISHVVEVFGPGFITSPLYMSLSSAALSVLTDLAESVDAYLIGQIHSHPGLLLDLSDLDIEHGIRVQNYLSVVCPYYAQRSETRMSECGVHVFEGNSYRRLPDREASFRLLRGAEDVTYVRQEVSDD
jgi:proteasome lid subunit RPN8/RPN11